MSIELKGSETYFNTFVTFYNKYNHQRTAEEIQAIEKSIKQLLEKQQNHKLEVTKVNYKKVKVRTPLGPVIQTFRQETKVIEEFTQEDLATLIVYSNDIKDIEALNFALNEGGFRQEHLQLWLRHLRHIFQNLKV